MGARRICRGQVRRVIPGDAIVAANAEKIRAGGNFCKRRRHPYSAEERCLHSPPPGDLIVEPNRGEIEFWTQNGISMSTAAPFEARIIDGDILAIVLSGRLDTTTTPEFNRQIQEHLDTGCSKVIIDCRNLGYVSSLGIGSLVALQTRLKRNGGVVKLAAIQGPVMDVIRSVRLDKMMDIYGDLEFARESFYPKGEAPPA